MYLTLLPGAPHGDGLRRAATLERGEITLNPNHLLLQPIALAGYRIVRALESSADAVTAQKWLDVLAAALTLALFAATLHAARVTRHARIVAVVLVAVSFNFLSLATSDHIKLVTGPFLTLTLYAAVRYCTRQSPSLLVLAGAAMAGAVLTLVSAVIWAAGLTLLLTALTKNPATRLRALVVCGSAWTVPVLLGFATGHVLTGSRTGLFTWIATYTEDPAGRGEGLSLPSGLSLARASFAFVKNLAYSQDIGPTIKALLSGSGIAPAHAGHGLILNVVTTTTAALFVLLILHWAFRAWPRLPQRDRQILGLAATLVMSFGGFALLWNTSEEEFWFQTTFGVALVAALLANGHRRRWVLLALVTAIFAFNNVVTFALPRRSDHYDTHVAQMRSALVPGDLVVYSGGANIAGLLYGVSRRQPVDHLSIIGLMERRGFVLEGAPAELGARIDAAADGGGRLIVLDLLEPATNEYPWTFLRAKFGITPDPFLAMLRSKGHYTPVTLGGHPAWQLDQDPRALGGRPTRPRPNGISP